MIRRKVIIAFIHSRTNATRQVGKQRERNGSERASRGREERESERERERKNDTPNGISLIRVSRVRNDRNTQ